MPSALTTKTANYGLRLVGLNDEPKSSMVWKELWPVAELERHHGRIIFGVGAADAARLTYFRRTRCNIMIPGGAGIVSTIMNI